MRKHDALLQPSFGHPGGGETGASSRPGVLEHHDFIYHPTLKTSADARSSTRSGSHMPCLFLVLPMTSALLRPRPASVCMPTHRAQRTRTLLPQADRAQRTRRLFAQLADWTPRVDEVSGATYYYNEQTGQSQWESPQAAAAQQEYGAQAA